MNLFKKMSALFIALFIFIPSVMAENLKKEYEVCLDDCDYTNINDVISDVNYLYDYYYAYDVTINIKDGATYDVENFDYTGEGYTQIYNIFVNSITIEGTGSSKPTLSGKAMDIISGPSFDGEPEVVTLKNINLKINGDWGVGFHGVDVNIENTDINITSPNGLFIGGSDSIKITNSNFYINNSGFRNIRFQGPVTIDGMTLVSNTYGLELSGNYKNNINNLTIKTGDDSYGVLINTFNVTDNYETIISNSDLSNPTYSVIATNTYLTGENKLNNKYDYDVVISGTKVNKVASYKFDNNYSEVMDQPVIYVKDDSIWNNPIKSLLLSSITTAEEWEKANKIEGDNGKVIVDMKNKVTLTVGDTKGVSLSSLFHSLDITDTEDVSWIGVNNTIYDVKDKNILPVKKGKSTIEYTYNDVNYKLEVIVLEESKNPNTVSGIALVGVLIVSIVALLTTLKVLKRLNWLH